MNIKELKKFLEDNDYELIEYKRFRKHDRVKILTPEKTKLTLTLTNHLEVIPFENAKQWITTRGMREIK